MTLTSTWMGFQMLIMTHKMAHGLPVRQPPPCAMLLASQPRRGTRLRFGESDTGFLSLFLIELQQVNIRNTSHYKLSEIQSPNSIEH